MRYTKFIPLLATVLIACESATDVNQGAQTAIGFSAAPAAVTASARAGAGSLSSLAEELVITGSNGILTITDVRFIVGEFKLERAASSCEDEAEENDDDCEKFESGFDFVDLPLTGGTVEVVKQIVPAGTYTQLKFETKDVISDDASDAADIANLVADIRAAGFSDWPEDASLVVVGTFTPTGGEPRAFRVYIDAEVKIEMGFDPPLTVSEANGTVDVEVNPSAWLTNIDGSLIDLSAFDFATTSTILKLEAKLENGFSKLELEGFDD